MPRNLDDLKLAMMDDAFSYLAGKPPQSTVFLDIADAALDVAVHWYKAANDAVLMLADEPPVSMFSDEPMIESIATKAKELLDQARRDATLIEFGGPK